MVKYEVTTKTIQKNSIGVEFRGNGTDHCKSLEGAQIHVDTPPCINRVVTADAPLYLS